jgi:hypothetical protein
MFEFTLTEKIKYSSGGQQIQTDKVEVSAPSKKQYRKTYLLQQIVAKALIAAQKLSSGKKSDSKDDGKIEAGDMKMLLMAGDADLEACVMQVEKLALDGCVEVGGNKINRIQWDEIDPVDQEKISFQFIADFIMPLV